MPPVQEEDNKKVNIEDITDINGITRFFLFYLTVLLDIYIIEITNIK